MGEYIRKKIAHYAPPCAPIVLSLVFPYGELFFNKKIFDKMLCVSLLPFTFASVSGSFSADTNFMELHHCGARSLTYGVVG